MNSPEAIFEIGLNHMGDVARAKRMLDELCTQGASHATLQVVVEPLRFTRVVTSADMLRPNCLTLQENIDLVQHARRCGLHPGATVVDPSDVPQLLDAGIEFFKILISDISFDLLHRVVALTTLPFYLSTGASDLEEIRRAMETVRDAVPAANVRLIHTVLQIPTPAENLHLANLSLLEETFRVPVAYGQHSDLREAIPAAIAAGADTVFVYVAEERVPALPDESHAILCSEAADLLASVRVARTMLGTRERRMQPAEAKAKSVIRRSIVAARSIRAGERLSERDLAFKRPGTGLEPWDIGRVTGRTADRDWKADEDIAL